LVVPLVALPDAPAEPSLQPRIESAVGPVLASHPSGRPWLLGSTDGRRLVTADNGHITVVLVGFSASSADRGALTARIREKRSVDELDDVAAQFVEGDRLMFARDRRTLRSQGPVFPARSVSWVDQGGVTIVADEQIVLRDLADLRADEVVLASRLTNAELSYPFGMASVWEGVRTPAPGHWLRSTPGREPETVAWWHPPRAEGSVAELAPRLHDAIIDALELRTANHDVVSADLSGGLDSTSLNFFLHSIRPHHHSLFLSSSNVANIDQTWAARAAQELGTDHHVHQYGSVLPALVDDRAGGVESFPEGPSIASVALASIVRIEEALSESGTTLHLNGHAGDALFGPVSTMLWSVFHSSEPDRLRRVLRHRSINRYPLGKTLRMLARTQSYIDDLRRIEKSSFAARDDGVAAFSRWAPVPNTHPALTNTVHDSIHQMATRAITEHPVPLSSDRTLHQILQYLVVHANTARRMNHAVSPTADISFESPYLDRRIVETALSLKIGDRAYQDPAKPLLAAARPDSMSLDYFTRRDKGDYTAEVFEQHRALRPTIRDLFGNGSMLEDLGLVHPERIMRSISDFSATGGSYTELVYIAFTERWLRSVAARPKLDNLSPAER
jgi:asparagine synthase (glutamine-hydrolysing)